MPEMKNRLNLDLAYGSQLSASHLIGDENKDKVNRSLTLTLTSLESKLHSNDDNFSHER